MFERFSSTAISVLMLAQEEARRLGHNYVGTEQILLGILGQETNAGLVLRSVGVTLSNARFETEMIIHRGSAPAKVEFPFTPKAKEALQSAMDAANAGGHSTITPEHIMHGLLCTEGSVCLQVLEKLGVVARSLKKELESKFGPPCEDFDRVLKDTRGTPIERLRFRISELERRAEQMLAKGYGDLAQDELNAIKRCQQHLVELEKEGQDRGSEP